MRLRRTTSGPVLWRGSEILLLDEEWDDIFRHPDPVDLLATVRGRDLDPATDLRPLAPIVGQELWAAGVTYFVSRAARMEESASSGGADVYARCYDAARPEIFFKANAHRVAGHDELVRIRRDSAWNVPEPELTLAISSRGRLFGCTIGNDMSSRDIEGENPLYLPQAKTYDGCAALGPEILVRSTPPAGETEISLLIERAGREVFHGSTSVARLKRTAAELIDYLTRESSFPAGCFLMTGAGVVPEADFTLVAGDLITIRIDGIGTLTNTVA